MTQKLRVRPGKPKGNLKIDLRKMKRSVDNAAQAAVHDSEKLTADERSGRKGKGLMDVSVQKAKVVDPDGDREEKDVVTFGCDDGTILQIVGEDITLGTRYLEMEGQPGSVDIMVNEQIASEPKTRGNDEGYVVIPQDPFGEGSIPLTGLLPGVKGEFSVLAISSEKDGDDIKQAIVTVKISSPSPLERIICHRSDAEQAKFYDF